MIKNALIIPIVCLYLFFALFTSGHVLEKIPHSQDEVAYLFQAKIFESGKLYLASYPDPIRRFFDHEFIVNNGKWYGKYPPGTSIFLAFGDLFGFAWIVNPLFGALSLLLLYALTKKLFSFQTALLASFFYSLSPFYILINSTFMSHAPALFFTLCFLYALVNRKGLLAGAALGILFLIRPYNTIPLIFLALIGIVVEFYKTKKKVRFVTVDIVPGVLAFSACVIVSLMYNRLLTGSFLTFPMNAYSAYDTVGFGSRGVEWGSNFTVTKAFKNLGDNTQALTNFLFIKPGFGLILFSVLAFFGRPKKAALLLALFLLQAGAYFFYFHPGTFLGPRYWFETSWIWFILIAEGLIFTFNYFSRGQKNASQTIFVLGVAAVVLFFLVGKEMPFLSTFHGHNGMTNVSLDPTWHAPAIVYIKGDNNWQQYGKYFILMQLPIEKNTIIFVRDQAIHNVPKNVPPLPNERLLPYFPGRSVYHVPQTIKTF